MSGENFIILLAANLAGIYFRLSSHRPFEAPRKAVILKPGDISGVMMATPLLAVLHEAYPQARFDWAVSTYARSSLVGNPRINSLVDAGTITLPTAEWEDVGNLIEQLQEGAYDTCFIPDESVLMSYIAWKAEIPQRVGLNIGGRGFAHTLKVKVPKGQKHEAQINLALAQRIGIESSAEIEFYPSDSDRSLVTGIMVEEVGWDGVMPLIVLHPGQGAEPLPVNETRLWPAERYALLAARLAHKYGAQIVLVGGELECSLVDTVNGLIPVQAAKLVGRLSLGQLGALGELADLYVGNQSGPTHVAAAVGCPTLALFGSGDPAVCGPLGTNGKVVVIQPDKKTSPFSWEDVVTVDQVVDAAEGLLGNRTL